MNRNNKIKVLYLHANNKDIGGADYCLFKLADQLNKVKFTSIVCLSMETSILDLYKKAGIKVYLIDMERIKKSKNPFYLMKLFLKLIPTIQRIRKIIQEENVDIVHGNDLLDIYGSIAGRLSRKSVTQYVRWILVSHSIFKNLLTNVVYILNNKVITVSDGVAKEMFSNNGQIKSNVVTCFDWIDMAKVGLRERGNDIRKQFNISPETPLVGVVGRLEYWKGQEVFIRAASVVIKFFPKAMFIIVGGVVEGRGREHYGEMLQKLVIDLKIQENVIFTGQRTDIYNIMKSLDILVHSSVTPDPLPGVIMEAMFCSKPVVGANAGGVPEEIVDGETGILYTPGAHREMAEAIIYLIENPYVAKQMGEAGKKRVEKVFNKNILCAKMEGIYKGMLSLK